MPRKKGGSQQIIAASLTFTAERRAWKEGHRVKFDRSAEVGVGSATRSVTGGERQTGPPGLEDDDDEPSRGWRPGRFQTIFWCRLERDVLRPRPKTNIKHVL